jgi:mannitol-1-phosphate 5-dehydrogenase
MLESALALSRRYQVDLAGIQLHITDLLGRFTNAALKDTCERVGGDPARKLSPADRLIGSATLALEEGITPAYIAVGAAAGVKRYLDEAGRPQLREEALEVLSTVSALEPDSPLAEMILRYYEMIADGCSLKDLRRKADELKSASLKDII